MQKILDLKEGGYSLYHSVGHRPNGSEEMAKAVSEFTNIWSSISSRVDTHSPWKKNIK